MTAVVLSRVYLILLALTILIMALRIARRYSTLSFRFADAGKAGAEPAALPDSRQESRKP